MINKREVPTYEELESSRINTYSEKIKNIINCDDLTEYVDKIEAMVSEDMSLVKIAATLLKLSMNKESKKINKNVVFENEFAEDESKSRRSSRGYGGSRGGNGGRSYDRNPRENNRSRFSGRDNDRNKDSGRNNFRDNDRNNDRNKKSSDLPSVDEMIKAVQSLGEPQKKKFSKPQGAGSDFNSARPNKKRSYGSDKGKRFSSNKAK